MMEEIEINELINIPKKKHTKEVQIGCCKIWIDDR